ncbi:MAG: hypothetical protein IJR22_07015 [Acidaminococcaceae bacterium]|nr:hypothetical protein [Acidaminococcaceae bacterium]
MEFAKMRNLLLQLQETDYRNFVKALVSIETNCIDEEKLDSMYENFMKDDSANLLEINEQDYSYFTKLQTLCAILKPS